MDTREILVVIREVLDYSLFRLAGTEVTVGSVCVLVLTILVTMVISMLVRRTLSRVVLARGMSEEGTVGVASRLIHYGILFTGFGIGLNAVGVNLSALFAAGALFAVALGFAMQNLTANFVSGLILLVERAIKPGDVLSVDGKMVKVREMGIRATVARTLDDDDVLIPNSILVQSTVTNYTLRDRLVRLRAVVGVVYSSDLKLVRKVLLEVGSAVEWRAQERRPAVLLLEFGASSVNYELSVWIDDPWTMRRRLSDLQERIWWALKKAEIVIAFPQVDVHFDPPVMKSLEGLNRAG